MILNLLTASLAASPATALSPIMRAVISMITIQSNSSSPSAIEVAGKTHRNVFLGYLAWLVVAAVVTAFFTWWVWRASNRQQDAIVAATEHDNLLLRTDLNTETGKVAGLQKAASDAQRLLSEQQGKTAKLEQDATDAKAAQQRVEVDLEKATAESRAKQAELAKEQGKLAEEQRKTADAQREAAIAQLALKKHLEEVAERQKWRHLTDEQRSQLLALLKANVKGAVTLITLQGIAESESFARELGSVLTEAGWQVTMAGALALTEIPVGLAIEFQSKDNVPIRAGVLGQTLTDVGLPVRGFTRDKMRPDEVRLVIGARPNQ